MVHDESTLNLRKQPSQVNDVDLPEQISREILRLQRVAVETAIGVKLSFKI
jgi:hypothetical protein